MDRAIGRGLTFQSSRATPDGLAPLAAEFFDRGGTALAHRVRVEFGDHAVDGNEVDWHAVTDSVAYLVDSLSRFTEMGVSDLLIVPGQNDETSMQTVETLVGEVVPQLPTAVATTD